LLGRIHGRRGLPSAAAATQLPDEKRASEKNIDREEAAEIDFLKQIHPGQFRLLVRGK
jgi:hypothetical protein